MNALNFIKRSISTSSQLNGKRNFKKFLLYNKRGPRDFKLAQMKNPHPAIPIDKRGVKDTGYSFEGVFYEIPEKIPELIVPNLTDFKLKPYVSYKTPEVIQSEFTSEDLFNAVYSKKIVEDFNNKKLKDDGSPEEPSEDEMLDSETAWFCEQAQGDTHLKIQFIHRSAVNKFLRSERFYQRSVIDLYMSFVESVTIWFQTYPNYTPHIVTYNRLGK